MLRLSATMTFGRYNGCMHATITASETHDIDPLLVRLSS